MAAVKPSKRVSPAKGKKGSARTIGGRSRDTSGADIEAMVEMASAFGHGVRKHDPNREWTWSENAVALGTLFMSNRLAKEPGKYWLVRDKALRRAYEVGKDAAKLVGSANAEITYDILAQALRGFGPFGIRSSGDCPF